VFFAPNDDRHVDKRMERHRAERIAALTSVALFSSLNDAERAHVADHLIYAPFGNGEVITHQGSVAHWLYILIGGRAQIRVHRTETGRESEPAAVIATLDAPCVFGEMGLMTGEPRTADVVAMGSAECYRLDKGAFEEIIRNRPEIAEGMAKIMASSCSPRATSRTRRPRRSIPRPRASCIASAGSSGCPRNSLPRCRERAIAARQSGRHEPMDLEAARACVAAHRLHCGDG
jgi:hypothetical protein